MRFFWKIRFPVLPKLVEGVIFLLFNSRIAANVIIGKDTFFAYQGLSVVLVSGTIIGDNCSIGLRCSTIRIHPFKEVPKIGNNVWCGPNSIIAGPVIIEDDVIIAASAYVNKSVPKGAIVAGCPAKIIGWRKDLPYNIEDNPKYKEGIADYLTT